ncbi:choline dehydrogenase-like flavoprotein [Neorhizobium galegae]|uniref:GMC family oxidoreductase n=1 Tax=Neorhizobium galegae TaxID=399 RepID=UPI001AE2BC5B|nr:GMC family oxidoreductase N-terminal domain-containing protein [Neorhizobium galegae]MBP2562507.1 choline dehydrogenase-like flavoprotein [Neorhizobium galegae]
MQAGNPSRGLVTETDYVIVGAGSAGCVLAARLSEDAATEVTILEAGGPDSSPLLSIPLGWGMVYSKKLYDWKLKTEPEERLNSRIVEFARGKVLGGSSSVNAMAYVRGHRSDYDRWAASGLDGWSYSDVLPYFRKQESWELGASEYRGGSGPLTTRPSKYDDPLVQASIEAGIEAGHTFNPDYNGAEQEGVAVMQSTIRGGRRCSAAVAYLRPALARRNLKLIMHAQATRVIFDGNVARGVEYLRDGKLHEVRARKEVILSAGVALSPQLLMLSGVGPADQLRRHGIEVRADLPKVGQNLRDHVSPVLLFRRKEPGPFQRAMRYDRIGLSMLQAGLLGTGIASDLPSGLVGFLKTPSARGPAPNLQVILNGAPLDAKPYLLNGFQDGFGLRVILLRPESSGRIWLNSANPLDAPRIHQDFLQHDAEWQVLREGIRMAREIATRPALGFAYGGPRAPGSDGSDKDDELDAFIRARALTTHHPLGTCAMAAHPQEGVVDTGLRVFGTERLRVVDASVMPDMVGGNINAAVIMIAEKIADEISGRATLSTAA